DVRITMIGLGAANVATLRLMQASGFDIGNLIAVDSKGIIHADRADIAAQKHEYRDKWRVATESNRAGIRGGAAEALAGADVCIGFSKPGPGTIKPEWVRGMAADAIVFPCANPVPEIWPWEAKEAGARVVGTGRSDFPNQLNNSLGFPAIFRGALDVRARTITDGMCLAAAQAIADHAVAKGLSEDYIVPSMAEREVFYAEAVAVGLKAQEEGVARLTVSGDDLHAQAKQAIDSAVRMTEILMESGIIAPPPAE
ncbi:MAG: NAD-dependent malic enzyme, partial [Anaerolineae bacterium]